MFYYLFLYTALKLTFDYLKNNYYLFNEHIYNSYAKKIIIKTFKNDNNIVNYVNKKTNKQYVITFDDKNIYDDMIYKELNDYNINLLENHHYKISGIIINKINNDLIDKINYINKYLSKIYIISTNPEIDCDILLDKEMDEYIINFDKDERTFIMKQYEYIMDAKKIDIDVSHNHPVNKFVHFWSSMIMIFFSYYYFLIFNYYNMVVSFFIAHVIRQSGHFFYERQDLNLEKLKFGHKNKSKKEIIITLIGFNGLIYYDDNIITYTEYLFMNIIICVLPHFIEIIHKYGVVIATDWIIKIITDPFTDILDFYKYLIIHPKYFLDIKNIL